uniref:Poly (ADP-ribose) polymerase family, member 6b n=1 Tax=Sphaeramia orbicularis TaxID=375764 RepID=A0A673A4V4_9TELE
MWSPEENEFDTPDLDQDFIFPLSILTVFISREWKHVTNDSITIRQKRRHSWFRPGGTIKKFRARLSIWLPLSKSDELQKSNGKRKIISPAMNMHRFTNNTTSYAIKNPSGELFAYTPSGKVRIPNMEENIKGYAEQRLLTLNEYCVVCDERHVFQNGPMLKPAVCTRELCVFSFYTLGVMSGATEDVATGAEIIDLLVAMCRAALQSSRKSIIFEPYPSVVDPCNPKTLAFSPKVSAQKIYLLQR